mgnify:CR=1 FL=1
MGAVRSPRSGEGIARTSRGPAPTRREEPAVPDLNRPQVPVEPVEDLLDDGRPRGDEAAVEQHVALLLLRRSQKPEQWEMGGLDREQESAAAVQHQDRDFGAGGE